MHTHPFLYICALAPSTCSVVALCQLLPWLEIKACLSATIYYKGGLLQSRGGGGGSLSAKALGQ